MWLGNEGPGGTHHVTYTCGYGGLPVGNRSKAAQHAEHGNVARCSADRLHVGPVHVRFDETWRHAQIQLVWLDGDVKSTKSTKPELHMLSTTARASLVP